MTVIGLKLAAIEVQRGNQIAQQMGPPRLCKCVNQFKSEWLVLVYDGL